MTCRRYLTQSDTWFILIWWPHALFVNPLIKPEVVPVDGKGSKIDQQYGKCGFLMGASSPPLILLRPLNRAATLAWRISCGETTQILPTSFPIDYFALLETANRSNRLFKGVSIYSSYFFTKLPPPYRVIFWLCSNRVHYEVDTPSREERTLPYPIKYSVIMLGK